MSATTDRELMRRDVHPAELLMPDGTLHRDVRVFITDRRLLAYRAADGIEVACVADLALPCSVPCSRATLGQGRLEVHLSDGTIAWVNQGGGCGCHSPLKALAPPVPWTR